MFALAVASAFATNTLPDPIISLATRNIELLPVLYLMPTVPAIVGGLLLAGSDMRRPWFSAHGRSWHHRFAPAQLSDGRAPK
jgi:hypothetical protein